MVAGTTCAMAERLRDVRLADARAADEQHVLVTLDEAARREVDDLRLRDLRVEVEVEVLERAHALEARAADPRLELLGVATLDLVGQDPEEEFAVAEIVVGGLSRAQVQ